MSPVRSLIRHYVEMVVVMVVGMAVLGMPAAALVAAAGSSTAQLEQDAPALMLLGMALTMTGPMVAWMGLRGHSWQASLEMGASMILPTLAVLTLLAAGVVDDSGTLLTLQHAVMLPSMLAAMLLRRDEYAGHTHGHGAVTA